MFPPWPLNPLQPPAPSCVMWTSSQDTFDHCYSANFALASFGCKELRNIDCSALRSHSGVEVHFHNQNKMQQLVMKNAALIACASNVCEAAPSV